MTGVPSVCHLDYVCHQQMDLIMMVSRVAHVAHMAHGPHVGWEMVGELLLLWEILDDTITILL